MILEILSTDCVQCTLYGIGSSLRLGIQVWPSSAIACLKHVRHFLEIYEIDKNMPET